MPSDRCPAPFPSRPSLADPAAHDRVERDQAVLQRRRAEAESSYARALVDYSRSISQLHYRKGSLLEYNGVFLAEGPWPGNPDRPIDDTNLGKYLFEIRDARASVDPAGWLR